MQHEPIPIDGLRWAAQQRRLQTELEQLLRAMSRGPTPGATRRRTLRAAELLELQARQLRLVAEMIRDVAGVETRPGPPPFAPPTRQATRRPP